MKKNRKQRRANAFDRAAVTGARTFGRSVPLAADSQGGGWTVLAYEVAMKGSDVALSKQDFEQCVANFNRYPCAPVTIEHADTDFNPFAQPPTSWREPNGHIEELRVGSYTIEGKAVASLEGRVSYLEPTASDVKAKKWRYGSITILQGAMSEEDGKDIGSMLWSWSLTAHPRLTRLPAIAASKRLPGGQSVEAGYWWREIEDRDDLLAMLRTILDLPVTSSELDVLGELAKLEGYVSDPATAEADGVEVDDIVGQIRDALRLPALTSAADVLAEVRKGLDTMPTEATVTPAEAESSAMSNTQESPHMKKFSLILAALGLAAAASEEDAEKRVQAFAQLGADALKALGLDPSATAADLAARVSSLTADAAKIPALTAELATFRAERDARTKADRSAYLDDLISARPELATVRASLALHAEHDWDGFTKAHPRPTRDQLALAAAEAAQRAQDPARTASVTVAASNPATKDAPAAPASQGSLRAEITAVLAEFGHDIDAMTVTEVIAKGHTPATLRAALSASA